MMLSFGGDLARFGIVGILFLNAFSNALNCDGKGYQLSSQEEVDARFLGCTIVGGDLFLASNYSGPLVLPGVKAIDGSFTSSALQLTSVSLPDLVNISTFSIWGGKAFHAVDMPLATSAEFISISSNLPLNLSLPSLVDIDFLQLFGNFSSLYLPKLESIDSRLTIRTGKKVDDVHTRYGHHLAVDLPSLVNATAMELLGNIPSISLPRLSIASDYIILGCDLPINITLPALTNVTGYAAFIGNFENLYLPNLLGVDGNLEILADIKNSTAPSNISFPKLATVGSLRARGPIKNLSVPLLNNVSGTSRIASETPLNCTPYHDMWNRVNTTSSTIRFVSNEFGNFTQFECTSGGSGHKGFSNAAKLGVGLGVGIPALLGLLLFLFCIHNWNRKRRQAQIVELPERRRSESVEMDGMGRRELRESKEVLVTNSNG